MSWHNNDLVDDELYHSKSNVVGDDDDGEFKIEGDDDR